MKIDGKQIAQKILEELKTKVVQLRNKNIFPKLAIILVGSDPASVAYVNQKKIKADEIGAKTTTVNLESRIQNLELIKIINKLNNDSTVHGIIVQEPLPAHIDPEKITHLIDPKKDVDGVCPKSKFKMPITMAVSKILEEIFLMAKRGVAKEEGLPTARTERQSKEHWREGLLLTGPLHWLKSKKIVVIGKGKTGGMPIINALQKLGIKPQVINSKTMNPELLTKNADILISAVGKPNVVKPEMLKQGVTLIGVGISRGESAKLTGDYDENEIENIASFYTPTPGGVGPVNVAMLLKNLVYTTS